MADTKLILQTLVEGTADARKKLGEVTKGVDTLGDSLKKNAAGFAVIGAVAAATFGAIVMAFNNGRKSIAEFNAVTTRLDQILKTSRDATDDQVQSLIQQAVAMEKVGAASKENIITAQSQLATFDMQTASIERLTPALVDYIVAEKGANASTDDFRQMTNSLAQALNGNFTSLTKMGFVLDDATKKQISQGTEMQRTAALAAVLDSTYAGFNKRIMETDEGRIVLFHRAMNNLNESIASVFLPTFTKVVTAITGIINKINEWATAHPKLFAAITTLATAVSGLIIGIGLLTIAVIAANQAKLALAATSKVLALLWSGKLIPMARGLAVAVMGISAPVWAIIAAVAALIAIGVLLWKNWDEVTKKASESWARVRQIQITEGMTIGRAWDALWNAMGQTVSEIWASIKNVVVIGIKGVVAAINFVIRRANDISKLGNLLLPGDPIKIFEEIDPNQAVAGVKSAVTGVYNFASNALKGVASEAVAMAKGAANSIDDALGGGDSGGTKKATEDLQKIINDLKADASAMNAELVEGAKQSKEAIIELNNEYENMKQELIKIKSKGLEELAELQRGFSELKQKGLDEMQKLQEGFTDLKNKGIQEIQELRNQITGLNSDMDNVQATGISDIAKRAIAAQRELQKIAGIASQGDVLSKAQSMSREELMAMSAQGKAFDIGGQKVTADNLIKVLDLTKEIAIAKTMVTDQDLLNAEVATNRTDVEKIIEKMNLDKMAIETKIKSVNDEIVKKQELHAIELTQYQDRMNKSKIEHENELAQYRIRITRKIADNEEEIASHTQLMQKKEMQIQSEFEKYKDLVREKRILDNNYFAYFGEQIRNQITQVEALINKMRSVPGLSGGLGLAGARADGGPVSGGSSYLVGERGPEIFTPSGAGKITPNNKMGSGGNVFISITGTFGQGVAEELGDYIVSKLARASYI